ncbi:hypothetical protein [Kitasatospora viridis]|uniref:Secreted protein n=1 Tax=Kitasatospora viridis TaxID=281105 RepID=A0A561UKJ8_9ACTN|nr:hypothetical protein [Kitasatospora viridis]TWF99887.1 hypothetical protein FHX73_113747 [Kitasatospora viridis]
MPRQRVATLAAASAVLAQLWGLGIGVAHAVDGSAADPVGRTVRSVGSTAGQGTGALPDGGSTVLPVSGGTTDVNGLLRDRIRAGGLPLPGQVTAVPDAFAIAAVLLPGPAAQPGSPRDPVRGATAGAAGAQPPTGTGLPGARGALGDGAGTHQGSARAEDPGRHGPGATRSAPVPGGGVEDGQPGSHDSEAASRDAERPAVGAPHPVNGGPALLTAPADGGGASAGLGQPVAAAQDAQSFPGGGVRSAVLIPIAAGLLLTGAAMYKHKGLPKGH